MTKRKAKQEATPEKSDDVNFCGVSLEENGEDATKKPKLDVVGTPDVEEIERTPTENWMLLAATGLGKRIAKKVSASSKFVGAHVSIAGSLSQAPVRAAEIGCRAFGLFLRNQRTWKTAELDSKMADEFRQNCIKYNFSPKHILPHGSYLLNVGSPYEETLKKSRELLLHEAQRCETLGLSLYNFHPGSSCGEITVDECIKLVAESVNFVHKQTSYVTLVLETMAGQGYTVGNFDEIKKIINLVDDKTRVGVCIDSCHVFAAGHDVSEKNGYNKMMQEFESKIGLNYLKAIHLNDSKGVCNCHLDRHENIGKGKIGLNGFKCFMNDPRLNDLPMILETPMGLSDSDEIKILYDL